MLALSYRLQLPVPERTRKTKGKIRISRPKNYSTKFPKRETVKEVTENDYYLLPSMIRHLEVRKAYLRKPVQADIDGVVNATPGNQTDVIIAVSVSGVP
jgi:hypothetical protein